MPIERAGAAGWLAARLAHANADRLTVVWQSIVRQYVPDDAWARVEDVLARPASARVAWVSFEPRHDHSGRDHVAHVELRCHADGAERLLARCGYHGPPVAWCAR